MTACYLSGSVCRYVTTLNIGEGINISAGSITPCASNYCLDCKSNYQICVACDTGLGFYLDGWVCKDETMLAPNKGINMFAGTIVLCSALGCVDCKQDYATCLSCDIPGGFYSQGITCKDRSTLAPGQGVNIATGQAVLCLAANCIDCKANHQNCASCNIGMGFYLQAAACKSKSLFTSNEGINISSGAVSACLSPQCTDCKDNYQECKVCQSGSGFYLQGSICKNLATLEAGLGLNQISKQIEACKVTNCGNCKKNNPVYLVFSRIHTHVRIYVHHSY